MGFLLNLLLTRSTTTAAYGAYAYAWTLITIIEVFADLGSSKSVLRYMPDFKEDSENRSYILGLGYVTGVSTSLVIALGIYISAPVISSLTLNSSLFEDVLRVFALVLPFNSVGNVARESLRGSGHIDEHIIARQVIPPVLRVLTVGIGLVVGYSIIGLVATLVVAAAIAMVVAVAIATSHDLLQPSFTISRTGVNKFYRTAVPLAFRDIGTFLYSRVDVLMLGILLGANAVGIYNVPVLLAGVLSLPLTGINQLFPAVAGELFANDDRQTLQILHHVIVRWSFSTTVLIGAVIGIFRTDILALFGVKYVAGGTVLMLFILAYLIDSIAAGSAYVLMMSDHQWILFVNQWTFGIVNVTLNYVLIPRFGIQGAAIATVISYILMNMARIIELWYYEGIFPYSITLAKPILANIGALIAIRSTAAFLEGLTAIATGGIVGIIVFGVLLYGLGIEQQDREIFAQIRGAF